MALRSILVALAACSAAPGALAQTWAEHADRCEDTEIAKSLDAQIASCTFLINDTKQTTQDDRRFAYSARGNAYIAQDKNELAVKDYSEALKIKPDNAYTLYARGTAYMSLEKVDESLADLSAAVRLDPMLGDAYGNRGNLYQYSFKDYDKAIADYNAALSIRPHPLDFANRASTYLYGKKQYDRAIADLDEAIKLQADDSRYFRMRCWARAMAGTGLDLAVADCTRALSIEVDGGVALIMSARGVANYKAKKFQDAWNDFDSALKQTPDDPEFLFGRGIAAAKLGRTAEAQADMAKAKAADSNVAGYYVGYGIRD